MRNTRMKVAGIAAALALGVACTPEAPTQPGGGPPGPVADHLSGPFGLASSGSRLYVAETDAGRITRINPRTGAMATVVDGLTAPAGVARSNGQLLIVTGGSDVPDASITGDASLFTARPGEEPTLVADLEAYELENNPDGQLQFDESGAPLDSLSNPFAVIAQRGPALALVADAGANDVLSISQDGTISTFFVPPVITTGACEGAPNNDPEHTGCDPVPTGLAYGPNNSLYVSTLSSEAPGEGRVYILDATTAEVRDVISGFDGPTGIAVAPDGTFYVSEVTYGAPPEDAPPSPDFDPASVGRIVRVSPTGERATASVPMPIGLVYQYGKLYSTAWSIAGFFGMSEAGQVVVLTNDDFTPEPAPPTSEVTTTTIGV